ncbi:MAG TPA: lysophospholipid acyltransferase family protein [Solirubrobacteraceae bacterium]|jgi:1-acyl-sn-glycerol-3-phosphate acyltransferase
MPDVELKPQVYKDPRPKEYFDQFHERARAGRAGWTYDAVHMMVIPYMLALFRARALATENVPNGPVILAPNHGSFMDHFFTGAFIRRRVRFMAKSQLFKGPIPIYIFSHGGVFPVRRGHHDEDAFQTAFKVLGEGDAMVMYCEGGRSRTGQISDEAKPGIGRLALQTGVPVVPTAILNSQKVRNWKRLEFPKVLIQYGEAVKFPLIADPTREQQQAVADYVLERIRELHTSLSALGSRGSMRDLKRKRALATPSPPPQPVEAPTPGSPTHAS